MNWLDINWNIISGVSSAIIALCALLFTIWQSVLTRRHNKLTLKPYLITWTHNDLNNGRIGVELLNNGLGPALIDNFIIKVDGQEVEGVGSEKIDNMIKEIFQYHSYRATHSHLGKGYSMPAQEKRMILQIEFTGNPPPLPAAIEDASNRTELIIFYKSIYGEEFKCSTEDEI